MRVYHFLPEDYGLMAIRERRLKISMLNDLNDPFEMLGIELSSKKLRRAMLKMRDRLSNTKGLHCFSKDWKNPVLWSHYADKHSGVCLGFDIADDLLLHVNYVDERLEPSALFDDNEQAREQFMMQLMGTKFLHWQYEDEARLFVELKDKDEHSEFYYTEFSEMLKLAEIIVGAEATTSRSTIVEAIGDLDGTLNKFKARAAFKSFEIVKNKNPRLWK